MVQDFVNMILENLPCSIWFKDKKGNYIYVNNNFCNFFNIKREFVIGKSDIDIFPSEIIEYGITNTSSLNEKVNEFVEINFNNQIIFTQNKPIFSPLNEISGFIGCFIDVSSNLQLYKEADKKSTLLENVFNSISDFIFYKDINGVYIGCNNASSSNFMKLPPEKIIGKTDFDIHPSKDLATKFLERDKYIMKNKSKELTHVTLDSYDGSPLYVENIKNPLLDSCGNIIGIVGISRDITPRKKIEEELWNMSYTDTLTGLYNRTYFIDRATKFYKENVFPLSVIMGDINGLKIINDSLGHLEGDKLISNISNIILSCCRKNDLVFRWGGDEIIILLPNSCEDIAQNVISKIYKKCTNHPSSIPLSIALGSSTVFDSTKSIDEALKEAEDKVYRHKLLQHKSFRSSVIDSLQRSLLEKSEETEQHTERLQYYASKIGRILGLNSWEIDELVLLCNLHDIGKIGIPEEILMKPGRLTDKEYEIMKQHSEKGYRITQSIPELNHIAKAVLAHHERWDGKGYPMGLSGENIPLISRIVSVIDSYDAMTNDRVYRKALSKREAINELLKNAGTQFDPTVVDIFLSLI